MIISSSTTKLLTWSLGLFLWIVHPFIMSKYYMATQRLNWYPPEADSIGIPIIGGFITSLVILPLFIFICYRATSRIPTSLKMLEWNKKRVWKSTIITTIFGILIFFSLSSIYYSYDLLEEIKNASLTQYEFVPIIRMILSLGWILLWMLLRSCFLSQETQQIPAQQNETHQMQNKSE